MSIPLGINYVVTDNNLTFSYPDTVASGELIKIDQIITAPSTNQALAFAFTKTKLQAIVMVSAVNLAVYTNAASSGSPQDTINLLAGLPFIWKLDDGYFVNPFGGNVTGLYVTLAGSVNSRFQVWAVVAPF